MSWMIELTFAILLTSVTGSILLLLWYFIGRLLQRSGYLNIQYLLLKIELLFFCHTGILFVFYQKFKSGSDESGRRSVFRDSGDPHRKSDFQCRLVIRRHHDFCHLYF